MPATVRRYSRYTLVNARKQPCREMENKTVSVRYQKMKELDRILFSFFFISYFFRYLI